MPDNKQLNDGDIITCIVNKRTIYSYKPILVVNKKYTLKSKLYIRNILHYELYEHLGFYFPFDHFETKNEIRIKKLKQLNKK